MDFFFEFAWEFCIEKWRGFLVNFFSGLRLPQNEARKVLEKFGENSEQNSGQNSGRNFRKIRETFVLPLSRPNKTLKNRDPKTRNRDGSGNSRKFRVSVEFPQKPLVQVIPGNPFWGPNFGDLGRFWGGNENGQTCMICWAGVKNWAAAKGRAQKRGGGVSFSDFAMLQDCKGIRLAREALSCEAWKLQRGDSKTKVLFSKVF